MDGTKALLQGFKKQAMWALCPYGCWTESDGSGVIFDRCYRPICRVRPGGKVEIVPPDEFIRYKKQRWFHRGFGISPCAATRKIVAAIIAKYGLAAELRRRRDLLKHVALPRWNGKAAT